MGQGTRGSIFLKARSLLLYIYESECDALTTDADTGHNSMEAFSRDIKEK